MLSHTTHTHSTVWVSVWLYTPSTVSRVIRCGKDCCCPSLFFSLCEEVLEPDGFRSLEQLSRSSKGVYFSQVFIPNLVLNCQQCNYIRAVTISGFNYFILCFLCLAKN